MLRSLGAATLVAVMLSVLASPLLYKGWKHRSRYRRVANTPVGSPTAVDHEETVLLQGVARSGDQRTTAPITDTKSLLAAWDVSRWVKQRLGSTRYWLPEARGVAIAGFTLDRDHEDVRVPPTRRSESVDTLDDFFSVPNTATGIDVQDVDVEVDAFDTEAEQAPDEEPPAHRRAFADRIDLDEQPQRRELVPVTRDYGTRRYREATVTAGQPITVRALVRRSDEPGESPVLEPPADGPMLLSTLTPAALQRRYRWAYWKNFHLFVTLIVVASLAVAFL